MAKTRFASQKIWLLLLFIEEFYACFLFSSFKKIEKSSKHGNNAGTAGDVWRQQQEGKGKKDVNKCI